MHYEAREKRRRGGAKKANLPCFYTYFIFSCFFVKKIYLLLTIRVLCAIIDLIVRTSWDVEPNITYSLRRMIMKKQMKKGFTIVELVVVVAVIAILSGITYASYIILLSGFKYKEISGFAFSFWVSAIAAVIMLIVCLATDTLTLPTSLGGWLLTILFAVSLNVGAVVLFQKGTFIIGGSRAAVLSTFEPVTSVLAGIVFFNEGASILTILGTVLVLAASVLIAMADIKSE